MKEIGEKKNKEKIHKLEKELDNRQCYDPKKRIIVLTQR